MKTGFLSEAHFDAIRRRAADGDPVIQAAWTALIEAAGGALTRPPRSLRENGGSPHFRQDGAYRAGQDGVRDTEANHRSGSLARGFARDALDLALAFRLTGDARYAEKAREAVHTWCLNENTRMFPSGRVEDAATPGGIYGGDVVLFLAIAPAFLAMHLVDDAPGHELLARAAVRHWVRHMVEPQRRIMFFEGQPMYNNWEDARLLYLASGALALHDLDLLGEVFDRWRAIIPLKMTDEGELPRETMRTRSMTYTLASLNEATLVAAIAAGFGVNLFDVEIGGRGLKRAIDYAARYLLDLEAWPFQMIEPFGRTRDAPNPPNLAVFEMALAHWGDPAYRRVIDAWGGRPVTNYHATLLFATVT